MQARYLRIGALLLFILPTFAFLTCDIYLKLSSGRSVSPHTLFHDAAVHLQPCPMSEVVTHSVLIRGPIPLQDGGRSGHRMSLRMARTAAPANRRRLEATGQPGGVPAPQSATEIVVLADVPSEEAQTIIAPPNLVSADVSAQQATSDIGPPDVVPADFLAEQAPATNAAPDMEHADIPAEQALAVNAASETAEVPAERAPPVMASPDEVRGMLNCLTAWDPPKDTPEAFCNVLLQC